MSVRFPFPKKLNPVWWLKNADQPGNEWGGFWRNPAHNLMFYVLGCADRRFKLLGKATDLPEGSRWHAHLVLQAWPPFACPLVSYKGARWQWYIGWRWGGELGARVTRKG